jgi:hypothetical protein
MSAQARQIQKTRLPRMRRQLLNSPHTAL